ncbi:hypothetical protein C5C90_06400 [Rathayibacter sp. AY1D4]|nr:hypothetical protein C5C35_10090 [Rathayibacter sp. AY1F8]PPH75856.1 hypothetical protein C5C90_06400 [Rathayibacter sp. AY1D4]PPH93984.1 hypothetical protein C5C64_02770 [Rathayibacter sp. AY1D3]
MLLRDPDGRPVQHTLVIAPQESLVLSPGAAAFALVSDQDGDEHHRIRVAVATRSGAVEIVQDERPVSPRIRSFSDGFLWIRRNDAGRPWQAVWWHRSLTTPHVLLEEPDQARRLDLRSVAGAIAVLASRGARDSRYWVLTGEESSPPTCRRLDLGTENADVSACRGGLAVLYRRHGVVRMTGSTRPLEVPVPKALQAEHLQEAQGELFVLGRSSGRRAVWLPGGGADALWLAPAAGTLVPAVDPITRHPIMLVSSPAHRAHCVTRVPGKALATEVTERMKVTSLTAPSRDGTLVPLTLMTPDGADSCPVVVHVYGAYGISLEGPFDPFTDDLLARGAAIAYCHVRGGGENGPEWHRQATGLGRERPIEDLLACLALLRELPGIDSHRLLLTAASAGALVAATVCLRRPAELRGLHLVHPFLDPVGALDDRSAAAAASDREEFGDPDWILASGLSPLATIATMVGRSRPLPRAWIRAGLRDARVDASAIAEFASAYRAVAERDDPAHVVLRATSGGHLSGLTPEESHQENVLAHAWTLDLLGLA